MKTRHFLGARAIEGGDMQCFNGYSVGKDNAKKGDAKVDEG